MKRAHLNVPASGELQRPRFINILVTTMAKTAGEQLFESYLASIGLGPDRVEYEPPIGQKAPDYLVHGVQDVLCEVEDFGEGDLDRKIADIPVGETRGGFYEPHVRVREKLEAGARQLREFKNRFPTVIVLHNPGFFVDLDEWIVAGAMYGNLQFVVEMGTDPEVARDAATQFDRKKAKLRPQQNTSISAVAVLENIKPNYHLVDEMLEKHAAESRAKGIGAVESAVEAWHLIEQLRPDADLDLTVPRLRVFHNVYAALTLDPTMFAGPHDQHLYPDPTDRRC